MHYRIKAFHELGVLELYELLKLRAEVFVVEQNCAYQDLDDRDKDCYHVLMWKNDHLVAYARILDQGISYKDYVSIGRVTTNIENRRSGIGKKLMEISIQGCYTLFGIRDIKISAQYHLRSFYHQFGFKEDGVQYLEDDIPHIGMLKKVLK